MSLRMFSPTMALGLAALALGASAQAQPAEPPPHHPARVLVRFSQDLPEKARGLLRRLVGTYDRQSYTLVPGLERLDVPVGTERAIQALSNQAGVLSVDPDYWVTRSATTDDPRQPELWGFQRVGAEQAWDTTSGDPGLVVAIIDEGLDITHPDLAANVWTNPGEIPGNGADDDENGYVDDVHGWDFYNGDATVFDGGPGSTEDSHGTHVAGTIAAVANNGQGVAGMAYSCRVMSLKFLGPDGGYTADAIEALQYAADNGARISNNSWGGGGASSAMEAAIEAAASKGHLFVAAAGNDGKDNDYTIQRGPNTWHQHSYPSDYPQENIISVAALDQTDQLAYFSNWGATSVDLAAPGTAILSTLPNGEYGAYSGTSMATPHVSGVAALVYSRMLAVDPATSWADVKAHLLATTEPLASLDGKTTTGGLLDAAAAQGAVNLAPVVTVSSPVDGTVANVGDTVYLSGSALDPEEGDVTASMTWESDRDGPLGTGGYLEVSTLIAGSHILTARAEDSAGRPGSATATVIVEDPNADTGGKGGGKGGGGGGGGGKKK